MLNVLVVKERKKISNDKQPEILFPTLKYNQMYYYKLNEWGFLTAPSLCPQQSVQSSVEPGRHTDGCRPRLDVLNLGLGTRMPGELLGL